MLSLEKMIAAGVVAAALIAGVVYTVHSYNSAIKENAELKAEAVQWKKAVEDYGVAVSLQNKAIEAWRKKGVELSVKVTASQRDIANLNAYYKGRVGDILIERVPQTCPAAIDWAVDKSKELSEW